MSLVVDNSVAFAWCFEDEHTQTIMDFLDRIAETGAIAPSRWPFEDLHGLLMAERRKCLDRRRRQRLASFLSDLPITLDKTTLKGTRQYLCRSAKSVVVEILPLSIGGRFI